MSPMSRIVILSWWVAIAMCLMASCNWLKGRDALEQEVRNTLDLTKFDKTKIDDHLVIEVSSNSAGTRFFSRDDVVKFIENARSKGYKFETSDFKVLSKTESNDSSFATVRYEVTWNVSAGEDKYITHVVSNEIWERRVDGWHRLAAAMDTARADSQRVAVQTISASNDATGQHPGLAAIAGPAKITCLTAASDIPNPQPRPSCNINTPGFFGDVAVGNSVGASGAGTVTLTCNGQGNRLTCTARVQ
jgi:hypothetical protein